MKKPWTESHGPIAATELEVRRAAAINELLMAPLGLLPRIAGDQIKPFALGLFDEIKRLSRPDVSTSKLRRATAAYVHSRRYYFASAQPGSMRHDLEGIAVEPLTAEDRLAAQQSYFALKAAHAENSKAEAIPSPVEDKSERIRSGLLPRRRT